MKTKLNAALENYLYNLGLTQEEIRLDSTGLKRITKELIVQTFEHFYPIITKECEEEIKRYLLINLPMTSDDKEDFIEEMIKNK